MTRYSRKRVISFHLDYFNISFLSCVSETCTPDIDQVLVAPDAQTSRSVLHLSKQACTYKVTGKSEFIIIIAQNNHHALLCHILLDGHTSSIGRDHSCLVSTLFSVSLKLQILIFFLKMSNQLRFKLLYRS